MQKLHRNLDEVVNGVQLGVTIVSLTLGWVGEPLLAQMMLGPVQDLPHASVYAHGIAIFISFVLITCLHVILGELVPKSLALQRVGAGGAGGGGAHGRLPDPDPPLAVRHEPGRRLGAAGIGLPADPAGAGALAR